MTEYRTGYMMCNKLKYCLALIWLSMSLISGWVSAAVITGEEAQTGPRTWE